MLYADESQLDFFESRIRPVLVQHCYECHSVAAGIVEDFRRWIMNGAIDPREAPEPLARGRVIDLEREREFWAYQPRRVFNTGHSIDGFVQPTAEPAAADRLLRRLSLDLTGLPPTLRERRHFWML